MTDQTQAQETAERYPNRYKPGQSGNLKGRPSHAELRARQAAKARELAAPLGGLEALNSIERTLIERCAELLCKRPRRYDEIVRRDNLVSRILRDLVHRRYGPAGSTPPSLRERLAAGHSA